MAETKKKQLSLIIEALLFTSDKPLRYSCLLGG